MMTQTEEAVAVAAGSTPLQTDGTVSYTQGDHTYTVSDDDLAQDVREAATSGDASGLSSVDQVTVSTGDVRPGGG